MDTEVTSSYGYLKNRIDRDITVVVRGISLELNKSDFPGLSESDLQKLAQFYLGMGWQKAKLSFQGDKVKIGMSR